MKKGRMLKYFGIAFAFVCSMFIMSNSNKVSAKPFILSDGTESAITYGEGQKLFNSQYKYDLMISNKPMGGGHSVMVQFRGSGYFAFYNSCTFEPFTYDDGSTRDSLHCLKMITSDDNSILSVNMYFVFNEDGTLTRTDGYVLNEVFAIEEVAPPVNEQEIIDNYCNDNKCLTNEEYEEDIENAFQEGKDSVDITVDNLTFAQNYITSNGYKSSSEYQQYGFDKYDEGIEVGYNNGYTQATRDIDITVDNQEAIDKYIEDNNMKTYKEYEEYGNKKYQIGMANADLTKDNELAIEEYIKTNNMKSEQEMKEYGDLQYSIGYKNNSFIKKAKRFIYDILETAFGWLF